MYTGEKKKKTPCSTQLEKKKRERARTQDLPFIAFTTPVTKSSLFTSTLSNTNSSQKTQPSAVQSSLLALEKKEEGKKPLDFRERGRRKTEKTAFFPEREPQQLFCFLFFFCCFLIVLLCFEKTHKEEKKKRRKDGVAEFEKKNAKKKKKRIYIYIYIHAHIEKETRVLALQRYTFRSFGCT